MNERLLMEVRRRLQAARSQLNTGGGAASEADAGSPVDSPLGGRPQVLQGRGASGNTLCSVDSIGMVPALLGVENFVSAVPASMGEHCRCEPKGAAYSSCCVH